MSNITFDQTILLSVVIPFYNVEHYIAQCLESVYAQDIPESEYEIICVNDGSSDKSRDIVIEYQRKHENLILIEHDTNKKLGSARNTGRAIAKGKYIWNVDSDDKVQLNVFSEIIDACESNNLDVLIFNFDHLKGNLQTLNKTYPFVNSEVLNGIDFIKKYCIGNFSEISPIWTQVYKREFLDEKKIFSPPINMGEDVPYTFKALLLADRIKSITKSCYIYRLNENSLGGAMEQSTNADKLYEKCFLCAGYVFENIGLIPKDENKIRYEYLQVARYIVLLYRQYLNKMTAIEKQKFKTLCKKYNQSNKNLINIIGFKNKILYYAFLYF